MVRLFGGFLLFASCIGAGLWMGQKQEKRIQQLAELIRSMEYLKGEISFARTTLPVAMEELSKHILPPFDTLFLNLAKQMRGHPGTAFSKLLSQEIEKEKQNWELLPEDVDNFYQSCCNLGYLDKEMQVHILTRYIKEQEKKLEQLEREIPQKTKLYRNLGVLFGAFLVIILM